MQNFVKQHSNLDAAPHFQFAEVGRISDNIRWWGPVPRLASEIPKICFHEFLQLDLLQYLEHYYNSSKSQNFKDCCTPADLQVMQLIVLDVRHSIRLPESLLFS